jgi:hypothetical protein
MPNAKHFRLDRSGLPALTSSAFAGQVHAAAAGRVQVRMADAAS